MCIWETRARDDDRSHGLLIIPFLFLKPYMKSCFLLCECRKSLLITL